MAAVSRTQTGRSLSQRLVRAFRRAMIRERRRSGSLRGRGATVMVIGVAALMMTVGALTSRGTDLRASRNTDLIDLVRSQAKDNRQLQTTLGEVRGQVEDLSQQGGADPALAQQVERSQRDAGVGPITGPAVRVTLTDAPLDVKPVGVDEDLLVVHQQDIQMVVNLLWQAGAEAMTIQGQRVVSTTAVKCVGNSVVLHGVPYAPPYVIEAVGDPAVLQRALDSSEQVKIYRQYADRYQLGWKQEDVGQVSMPAFTGSTRLSYAKPKP